MSLYILQNSPFLKELIFKLWLWDARFKVERISEYLSKTDRILDIGTGPGSVCLLMQEKEFDVTPVDIIDQTLSTKIEPKIYDGKILPFNDNSFDTALILTVLHHTSNPYEILSEAKRAANKIVIIEDIYSNTFQKYLTYFTDSIVNLEFSGHPHSNQNDSEWKRTFSELGLKLKSAKYNKFLLFFKQATYFLEK